MMRPLSLLAVVLLATLVVGCSSTDTRSDAERIVGVRTAESVNARVVGLSVPISDLSNSQPRSTVAFDAGGAFNLALTLPDSLRFDTANVTIPLPDAVTIVGTYALDDAANRIVITRTDITGTLTLGYAFRGSNDLELIAEDAATLSILLGLAGPEAQALAGVVQGGSIRFNT